ncbi:unnamed protein product [Durusdinium trenchii]|uniref:Uncharacterized protein n=1 Tax=Durusdinium trenchii TaxID=1381693 RepID=A0ABP0NXQ0_9DINO
MDICVAPAKSSTLEISRRLVAFNEELASGEGWMINDVFGYHRRKQEAY